MEGFPRKIRILQTVFVMMFCAVPAFAQSGNELASFVGRWTIDLAQTKMGRMGPNAPPNLVRSAGFSFIFAADGDKLRMDTYANYPQPMPTLTALITADGEKHPCTATTPCYSAGADPNDQSFAYVKIDSHMIVRLLYRRGAIREYTSYVVSSDASIFTMIAWSAETPQWQNIQVFTKQP